jgi:hypothetical protein
MSSSAPAEDRPCRWWGSHAWLTGLGAADDGARVEER